MDAEDALPPLPSGLRPAALEDVPRVAVVAAAGFFHSPVFAWERRSHAQYPLDTIRSYEKMFADSIADPRCVTVVVTDAYDPAEKSRTGAALPAVIPGWFTPEPGGSAIVGVATWRLPATSRRVARLPSSDAHAGSRFDGGLGRDKSARHAGLFHEACAAARAKYFAGHQLMNMVVVHPAYWQRGHGSRLVKWGMALADIDEVHQGVLAATMGEKLYLSLGYTKLDEIFVEDATSPPPQSVRVGILDYDPHSPRQITDKV